MGFPEAEPFLSAYRHHCAAVRALAERIHFRLTGTHDTGEENPGEGGILSRATVNSPLRRAVRAADTADGEQRLDQELAERGIADVPAARRALVRLAVGPAQSPHPASTRRLFGDLAGPLLDAAARAADPARALEGFAELADRKLLHRSLYQSLLEQTLLERGDALEALVRLAGSAPAALRLVIRYPELTDLVQDPEQRTRRKSRCDFRGELSERLADAPSYERQLAVLRRYRYRELVRLAARHVLAPLAPPPESDLETGEWSDLADALVEAALRTAVLRLREQGRWSCADAGDLAVLALGRLGGRELHLASDLDLLFVYGPRAGLPQQAYEALARAFNDVVQIATEEGRLFALDLRLRPEGRQGFSVLSLEGARHYYGEGGRAQTWEFQSLTRLRPVTGSAETAAELHSFLASRVYRAPVPEAWRSDICEMKRRIERERAPAESRDRHLKLGPGGLSDIEFVVQYLQLAHGGENVALRGLSTGDTLRALAAAQVLTAAEYRTLADGRELLTRLRQELFLLEANADLLPAVPAENRLARALARALGHSDFAGLEAEFRARTSAVRAVFFRYLA